MSFFAPAASPSLFQTDILELENFLTRVLSGCLETQIQTFWASCSRKEAKFALDPRHVILCTEKILGKFW